MSDEYAGERFAFTRGGSGDFLTLYEYVHSDGSKFGYIAYSLDEAREKRDVWLKKEGKSK